MSRITGPLGVGMFLLLASSCRTVGLGDVNEHALMDRQEPVEQSIVFLVHGDADYLYHGADGTAHQADEEAVIKALRVARRNPTAEVFIFHERARTRRFFLFPRYNGTFYYFRGGDLLVQETYRRGKEETRLEPEAAYYQANRSAQETAPVRMFIYLGHEIPEMEGVSYDTSRRRGAFSIDYFARGVAGFAAGSGPFDLMVLSTCNSGTPHTIQAMAPLADYIVASPDNLHLSHFDLAPLERLDLKLGATGTEPPGNGMPGTVPDLAREFAQASFDRLTAEIQTVVTIAVYDTERTRAYMEAVAPTYDSTLAVLQEVAPSRLEHVDCREVGPLTREQMSEGVAMWYRAPRFGRRADRAAHSGWQCWQEAGGSLR